MNNSIGNFGSPRPFSQTGFGRIGPRQDQGNQRTEGFLRRHNKGPAFQEAQIRRHGGDPRDDAGGVTTGGDDTGGLPELTELDKKLLLQVLYRDLEAAKAAKAAENAGPTRLDDARISAQGLSALAGDGQSAVGGGKIGAGPSGAGGPTDGPSGGVGGGGVQQADPEPVPPADGGFDRADPAPIPPPGDGGVQRADPTLAPPTGGDGDSDGDDVQLADPVQRPRGDHGGGHGGLRRATRRPNEGGHDGDGGVRRADPDLRPRGDHDGDDGVQRADPDQRPPVDDEPKRPTFTARKAG